MPPWGCCQSNSANGKRMRRTGSASFRKGTKNMANMRPEPGSEAALDHRKAPRRRVSSSRDVRDRVIGKMRVVSRANLEWITQRPGFQIDCRDCAAQPGTCNVECLIRKKTILRSQRRARWVLAVCVYLIVLGMALYCVHLSCSPLMAFMAACWGCLFGPLAVMEYSYSAVFEDYD